MSDISNVFHGDSFIECAGKKLMLDAIGGGNPRILYSEVRVRANSIDAIRLALREAFDSVVQDKYETLAFNPRTLPSGPANCVHIHGVEIRGDVTEVQVIGDDSFIESAGAWIRKLGGDIGSTIKWVYNKYMEEVEIQLNKSHMPTNSMYPFIDCPLEQYYKDFYNSTSNVLLCIGEPGTGKTTFLRGMLDTLRVSAMLSYESSIFDSDEFFAKFMSSSCGIMIVEDADVLLTPRTDGNSSMQRFLNAGDGLVTLPRRKMVFTTNLPNTKNVDPALIRSGRCFDVIHFRKLKPSEIQAVRAENGIPDSPDFNEPRTLAYVMNHSSSASGW